MTDSMPGWVWGAVVIGVVFALVALVAGFWMLAPIVVIGLLVLVLPRLRRGAPPE